MPSKSTRDSFDQLLKASASARTRVRSNAARGRWRDSETDTSRAAAYARRTTVRKRNGAETLLGRHRRPLKRRLLDRRRQCAPHGRVC